MSRMQASGFAGIARLLRVARFGALVTACALVSQASAQTNADTTVTGLSLELNVPAMRLDVLNGRNLIQSYPVAVGLRRYPTPLGNFSMLQVTWNPWWYPPESGWARKEKITPPGPDNPMGKVKLHIGGKLYLHGTPFTSSIGRATSHGCVRMRSEDAVALARLVQSEADVAFADHDVSSLLASWAETRVIDLPEGVPVRIVYQLAEVRSGNLILHPDIYRLRRESAEAEALTALARASHDTSQIDRAGLRRLLRKARSDNVQQPVEQLILPRSPTSQRGFPDRPSEAEAPYSDSALTPRNSRISHSCGQEGS